MRIFLVLVAEWWWVVVFVAQGMFFLPGFSGMWPRVVVVVRGYSNGRLGEGLIDRNPVKQWVLPGESIEKSKN